MKKLFCLFIFGLILGGTIWLCMDDGQHAHARKIAGTSPDSDSDVDSAPCLSMALKTPLNPRSNIHEAGTGLGAVPRSVEEFHSEPLFSINLGGDTPNSRSLSRGVATKLSIWKHSDTITGGSRGPVVLRVGFMGADSEQKAAVKRVASEWIKYANIRFQFVESGQADIRIGFDPNKGHWSYVGSDANYIDANEPTMNLALRGEYMSERVILHEFGHALGLEHEHQNPAGRIQWNESVVINELMQSQGWSEDHIRLHVINRKDIEQTNFTAFDPKSIMVYVIPNRWTIGDFETSYNAALSAGDKRFISTLYRQTAPSTKPVGDIVSVRTEHNQTENGRKGIRIRVTFEVDNFKSKPGIVCAYFYRENGTPLKDNNRHYWSTNGNVCVGGHFQPGYVNTIYRDYRLFIPLSELHLSRGRHDLKFMVQVFNRSTGKALSHASDWGYFWAKIN